MISCTADDYAGVEKPWTCRHGRDIRPSDSSSLETIQIDKNSQFLVQSNDVVGWHTPLGDVIDYRPSRHHNASTYIIEMEGADNVSIGQIINIKSHKTRGGRVYGIKALLKPAPKPTFMNTQERVTFKCPVGQGHHVTDINAMSQNGQGHMNYSIEGYSPWFYINHKTGKVSTSRPIHGNFTTQVTVRVTSTCGQMSIASLTLECIHLGVEQITLTKQGIQKDQVLGISYGSAHHITFRESVKTEVELFNVLENSSSSDDVMCTVSSSAPPLAPNVLYASGSLLLFKSNGKVTHNATPEIYIRFKCIHIDRRFTEENIIVHVIRDLEPMFQNLPASVTVSARHSRVGDVVYHVTAIDRDSSTLTFDSVNCSCPFSVSPDSNHPPEFIYLPQSVLVPENSLGPVLTIISRDFDEGDNITVQWVWEDVEAATYFYFNESAHQVIVRPEVTIDYEHLKQALNMTSFPLLLTLDDGAMTSQTLRTQISVIDENEAPTFLQKVLFISCDEGKAGSQVTTEIPSHVSDPDLGDALQFEILPSNLSHMFEINRKTGFLSYQSDYDVDPLRMPERVTLDIRAWDKGDLYDSVKLELTIQNVNKYPTVSAPSSVTLAEDTPPSTPMFLVSASDPDSQDEVTIDIECSTYSNLFNISETGIVALHKNASLDFESTDIINFLVSAHDGHVTSTPMKVQLYITDVNEAPYCSRDIIAIQAEEGKAGDTVSSFDLRNIFEDPENDQLIFSIIEDVNDHRSLTSVQKQEQISQSQPFSIDLSSGWLFLSHDVDVTREEGQRLYSVRIRATDTQGLSAYVTALVTLTFVNSAPHLVDVPAHVAVLENHPPNDAVFTVLSLDGDNDTVTIRHWFNISNKAGWIQVNSENGEVRVTNRRPALAQDTSINVTVLFTAFDGYLVSDTEILTITIVGVNDAPQFSTRQYSFSIDETQVGLPLNFDLNNVLDPDPGDTMTFALSSADLAGDVTINSTTGELSVRADYDIDMTGISGNISVYNTVLAQDRDSGRNGEIVYHIVGSTLNDTRKHFSLDAEGWIITSIVPRKSAFTTLYLAVADRGWPSQVTMATVNIVQVEPSENDTASASLSSAASKNSISSSTRSEHARINGILILIGLLAVCCVTILTLSFQLWKARRSLRSNLSQAPGSACQYQYHDYSHNKVISGLRALRQARAPVAGHEFATEGTLQISGPGGLASHCATEAPRIQ
ncbi:protocadherin fat 1 [Plakobranchus ocellatus]|uniref:Protocadherin fat 1 n=1 Tax=Plakobranchus ocellatus TaxID=259542 RepID=A0AAV4BPD2_9GAST|nr:protocadherin fat 1 [Plakobranchus ocellatus]